VRIAFAGDVNMSMLVGQYVARRVKGLSVPEGIEDGFPFTAVRDRLQAADIAVANLECVVSLQGKRATEHNPFRAPVESISVLRDAGFDILSVANNHTRDFGPAGLRGTRKNLIEGGITPIGAFGADLQEAVVRELRGVRVAFLAYYNIYKSTPRPAYRDVKHARSKADLVVVFNHWGSEKQPQVQPVQQSFGRGLIDAGADVVVGTHVHVLQPEEWYRERLIFYGLGNFVFNGMNFDEAHRTGGYLEVDVDQNGIRARRFYRIRLDQHGAPQWLDTSPQQPDRLASSPDGGATQQVFTAVGDAGSKPPPSDRARKPSSSE
jgi:poly-gamma-glutamate capsule biosynthesis protein CapA/YwtB (metallophosphatase superfamily)